MNDEYAEYEAEETQRLNDLAEMARKMGITIPTVPALPEEEQS
jgi:hypothetical protein